MSSTKSSWLKKLTRVAAFGGMCALAVGAAASAGCVASREARNGVFNENQYVRKDFLIRPGEGGKGDPGWFMRATILSTSTPNPLGSDTFYIVPGIHSGGQLVRFRATQDKLQMVHMREITSVPSPARTEEVVNAWPATNVDLKYRINLDGETTNFYEENQEQSWEQRQWLKLSFAKNDMSDVAPFGGGMMDLLSRCTDVGNSTSTLVPGSFKVDEKSGYMQWTLSMTVPLHWVDPACIQAMSSSLDAFVKLGRQNVTFEVMYSLTRAKPMEEVTYKPLVVDEKDPIRHKYGFFDNLQINRDENTGMMQARQQVVRFDPEKPIVWYFAPGFPEDYKKVFTDPGGIGDGTNKLMEDAGVKARVSFKNFDDDGIVREFGDMRYSWLRWLNDRDQQELFAGVSEETTDPRTGEVLTGMIEFSDFAIKDYYVQRIDSYLKTVGASLDVNSPDPWPDPTGKGVGACKEGETKAIVPATVAANHNGNSSLYQKMQGYLQKPAGTYPNLGPKDFIVKQDADFYKAFYAILPYEVFADPDANAFVIREGGAGVYGPGNIWKMIEKEAEFHAINRKINRGETPFEGLTGPEGIKNATGFMNKIRDLSRNHRDLQIAKTMFKRGVHLDPPESFSFEDMMARDARHCVKGADGTTHWETKEEWVANLIRSYWVQVMWHEFGHAMGLHHNFMASVDRPNFPVYKDGTGQEKYGLYASSVMEYNAAPDRVFAKEGWAPYDKGAITWIYANSAPDGTPSAASVSGQNSPTSPWKDPNGWKDEKTERQFLYCSHQHLKYTPFCRMGDSGTTPSEIIANAIDAYEWQYQWRNFRVYRKFWDNSKYAYAPVGMILDMRRFMSTWAFSWGASDLKDVFRKIGITNPDPKGSALEYFSQLANKFNADASGANQMVAAFHKAVIQQSSGERPYRTIYDKYYGDTTQEGIILDKLYAMAGWVGMWPTDNYDPNVAGGYIASYSSLGDASYRYVAEDAVLGMLGGQYDVYPYFVPLAISFYAQDTHSPSFSGNPEVRDWIGGHTFTRLDDFLAFFRDKAVDNSVCTDVKSCTYDPRDISDKHNEFIGPDRRVWIWAFLPDRNKWMVAAKDRHIATYRIMRDYNDAIVYALDDGAYPGRAYSVLLPLKYTLDAFEHYN